MLLLIYLFAYLLFSYKEGWEYIEVPGEHGVVQKRTRDIYGHVRVSG